VRFRSRESLPTSAPLLEIDSFSEWTSQQQADEGSKIPSSFKARGLSLPPHHFQPSSLPPPNSGREVIAWLLQSCSRPFLPPPPDHIKDTVRWVLLGIIPPPRSLAHHPPSAIWLWVLHSRNKIFMEVCPPVGVVEGVHCFQPCPIHSSPLN